MVAFYGSIAGGTCSNALHSVNMTVFYKLKQQDLVNATITRIFPFFTYCSILVCINALHSISIVRLNFAPQVIHKPLNFELHCLPPSQIAVSLTVADVDASVGLQRQDMHSNVAQQITHRKAT